jgi:hypothetical protein
LSIFKSKKRKQKDSEDRLMSWAERAFGKIGEKLPLDEFMASPYPMFNVLHVMTLLKALSPKAQQIVLAMTLQAVEAELPAEERAIENLARLKEAEKARS